MTTKPNLFRGYHYPMQVYLDNQRSGGFTQLSLDLTSRCNYRCDWCFNKDLLGKEEGDKLTLDEKKRLLEQSRALGARTLVIPGTGEPTLDKDFYPLVEFTHNLGMATVVYSNLTGNLNPDGIHKLFENDVSLGIKFDSLKPDFFERRYHTNQKSYNTFLENLASISRIYKNSEQQTPEGKVFRAILNMVLTHENMEEIDSLNGKSKELGFPLYIRPVKPVTWAAKNMPVWKKLGNVNGANFPDTELIELAQRYNTLFSPSSTLENHCAIYSFGLTVKNNGDIQICPDHYESRGSFGNVRTRQLKDITRQLSEIRQIKPGFCVMLPEKTLD